MRDDTWVSGRSFLRGNLKVNFSMCHHAFCKVAPDWLLCPSLGREFQPFFHLQLTLGRGNTSRTFYLFFIFILHVLWVAVFRVILYCILAIQPFVYSCLGASLHLKHTVSFMLLLIFMEICYIAIFQTST